MNEYRARIHGKYTRGMLKYLTEMTEERERREYDSVIARLTQDGTSYRASLFAVAPLELSEVEMTTATLAISWSSEFGYPIHVIWHDEGFEVRTARYIGRNCLSLFPGIKELIAELDRQNAQVSLLIQQMSQEHIQRAANVDLETAQRWMVEAEERDPMPEYDANGRRTNRTHNRYGEAVR